MASAKTDFADALKMAGSPDPASAEAKGILKIVEQFNRVAGLLKLVGIDVKEILRGLIQNFLKGKINRQPGTATTGGGAEGTETGPPVPPQPPGPGTEGIPQPPGPGIPPKVGGGGGTERRVAGLRVKFFFIERKNNLKTLGGGRYILPREEFLDITERGEWLRGGDRVHLDITPYDQFGREFQPGGEENRLLLIDPNGTPDDSRNHRISHVIDGLGDLTSEYDGGGTTPVITIPFDPAKADSDETGTMEYQARYNAPDGSVVESNRLRSLNIKY